MRAPMRTAMVVAAALVTGAVTFIASQGSAGAATLTASAHNAARVCPAPLAGQASCHSWYRTDVKPTASAPGATWYGPADLQAAYKLPSSTAGSGQTIAIVDAYDDPTAESDLGVYRSHYGLSSCTTANGCFKKVNQNGVQGSYPRKDAGWALEISLDLDMASAICPNCKILLVEASSNSLANLGAAVDTAANLGANVISNSYGGSDRPDTSDYNHPNIAITASTGDSGYGVEYPASSEWVTAVGGTSLNKNGTSWSETAWSGAGSGCSAYQTKLPAATDVCGNGKRAVADVSAVADPNTGVAVYDSTRYQGSSGWWLVGGTSASAPIIAAVYALAGNASSVQYANSLPYGNKTALNDVVSGSNGSCSIAVLCNAGTGWDGPTGLGTPNGTGAF